MGLVLVGDHVDRVGRLTERSLDLIVSRMPHEHDRVAGVAKAPGFRVDLANQRAGGVDHPMASPLGGEANLGRDAMGREHHRGPMRDLVDLVDEHHSARLQLLHDVAVVDDLPAHVERRAVANERALDDVNGALNPRA